MRIQTAISNDSWHQVEEILSKADIDMEIKRYIWQEVSEQTIRAQVLQCTFA